MNARLAVAALLLLAAPAFASADTVVGSEAFTIGPIPAEVKKREVEEQLHWRLGAAAVAAGFTADWTDAQLERAMAVAVKTREGAGKPVAPKTDAEPAKAPAPAGSAAVAKPAPPPR